MKNKIYFLLLFILLFVVGCGKNEYVINTEKAIDSIGIVSENSSEKIEEARNLYNSLTDSDQLKVDNYSVLLDAELEYANITIQRLEEKSKYQTKNEIKDDNIVDNNKYTDIYGENSNINNSPYNAYYNIDDESYKHKFNVVMKQALPLTLEKGSGNTRQSVTFNSFEPITTGGAIPELQFKINYSINDNSFEMPRMFLTVVIYDMQGNMVYSWTGAVEMDSNVWIESIGSWAFIDGVDDYQIEFLADA